MEIARAATVNNRWERLESMPGELRPGPARWSAARLLTMIILPSFVMLALTAAPVQAARVHALEVTETLPGQRTPSSVAINQATHHFYVVTAPVGPGAWNTFNFEASGQIDLSNPELTGGAQGPFRVAADNSSGSYAGYVYTVQLPSSSIEVVPHEGVQQFNASGEATGLEITEASLPPDGTGQLGGLPPVENSGSFRPRAVTVDGSGNVFVVDIAAEAIDVFTATGTFLRQLAAGTVGSGTRNVAADSSGHIYIARDAAGGLGNGLFEFDAATGECVPANCAPIDPAPVVGVAVDNAAGTIFTSGILSEANLEGKFTEYEAATGKLLGVTHPRALHKPEGIAVDEDTGRVIVVDGLPAKEGTVKIFGPAEEVPTPVTEVPEGVTDHSATLKATLKPEEVSPSTCLFQYATDEEFKEHGFEGSPEVGCRPEGPFSGNGEEHVHADITGLRGGTVYHQRLVGVSEGHVNPGEDIPFTTAGPTITGTAVAGIGAEGATLQGLVDPRGSATTYSFQYLTRVQFEAGGWAAATEVPAAAAAIGEGSTSVPVSQVIGGLTPGTAYRVRIVAVSTGGGTAGATEGEEVAFATQTPAPSFGGCPNEARRSGPSAMLPDCRAYEQASPTDKNGAGAQGGINSVQASLAGDRVTFFSNTGIPGGEGAQEFPTFMASRAPDGASWSTQGLLPPASYGSRASVLGWTEDLRDTYDFASKSFGTASLLRRQSSDGATSLVSTLETKNTTLTYAGSSQGGAVALLESARGGLAPGDLEGRQNVYAYDRGTDRLVVAGVLGDGEVPSEGAVGGPYNWLGELSSGGALGRYYTQTSHAISADGTRVFFSAAGSGQLYVRVNPFGIPAELNPAECLAATNGKACTVRISAPEGMPDPETPAAFVGASADGRLVYFLDKGRLTADSTAGPGYDLYRYDLGTGNLRDLTPDPTDRNGARVEGMLAVGGPAGEDAYFVAPGALAEGASQAPTGETNLYGLHGMAIEYIARLGTGKEEALDWAPASKLQAQGAVVTNASRISGDGRTLLFTSSRRLTSYDNEGRECVGTQRFPGPCPELFFYRAGQGISCISCNPTGEAPAGPSGVQSIPPVGYELGRKYSFLTRNLSADGRRVVFDSADRLVAADQNRVNDVYEWEAEGEGSCESEAQNGGCLYLISSGAAGAGPSWFGDADEEGKNIFFFTAQSLVAQDRDELVDVYDARIEGGILTQQEEPPARCEEETTCRGAAPAPPNLTSPGTSSFHGSGNPAPAKPCKKGKVRRHGECVRRMRHRTHRHHGRKHKGTVGHHAKVGRGHKNHKRTDKKGPGHGKGKGGRR